jgi:hypothetical protein
VFLRDGSTTTTTTTRFGVVHDYTVGVQTLWGLREDMYIYTLLWSQRLDSRRYHTIFIRCITYLQSHRYHFYNQRYTNRLYLFLVMAQDCVRMVLQTICGGYGNTKHLALDLSSTTTSLSIIYASFQSVRAWVSSQMSGFEEIG